MKQFAIGDTVSYGSNGICRITDICELPGTGRTYYVLEQNRVETSRLYVPIDSEKLLEKLRHVLTHEQIDAMLADVRGRQVDWIDNRAERQSRYTEIARGGITGELLLLIHRLYLRRAELAARGRRLPEADLSLLKLAESLVNEEFSQALGIPPDAVADYIRAKLEE